MARIDDDGDPIYPDDDDGTTDGGTTDDGTNDGGSFPGWDSIAPEWISNLSDVSDRLIAIAKNPKSFVLGALLAAIFSGILDIAKIFYDGLRLILIGDGIGYVEGMTIGIEDLFYISWDIISGAGEAVASPILGVVTDLQNTALSLAGDAGIASFPMSVLLIVVTIVGFYVVLSQLGRATLAAIPVIGPFLESLLP